MAKIGLNFGEKIEIAGKSYRTLNDGIDAAAVLGDLIFGKVEGNEVIFEDQAQNGQMTSVNTGEIRGVFVSVKSQVQEQTVFVLLTEMTESDVEAVGIKYREAVELEDLVMTYSSIDGRDIYNLFASRIKKKTVAGQPKVEDKKPEDQKHKG